VGAEDLTRVSGEESVAGSANCNLSKVLEISDSVVEDVIIAVVVAAVVVACECSCACNDSRSARISVSTKSSYVTCQP